MSIKQSVSVNPAVHPCIRRLCEHIVIVETWFRGSEHQSHSLAIDANYFVGST